jgi:hypothetical protein
VGWQITLTIERHLLADPDPEQSQRVRLVPHVPM